MSKDLQDCIQQVIGTSNELIASLDSRDFSIINESTSIDDDNLLKLMNNRDKLIHHMFEHHDNALLSRYSNELSLIDKLDKQLILKMASIQTSAKSKILQMKKNKKAINLYQKL